MLSHDDPDAGYEARLKGDRKVWVRPVRPEDKEKIRQALLRMSPESRYQRFHAPVTELSEEQLRYLTEIDHVNHAAWGAVSLDEPGEPGIGVARYIRDPSDPTLAAVAVTVVDAYHGLGLGRLLMQTLLVAAAANGIEQLVAHVLPENRAARELFLGLGAATRAERDGVIVMEMPVRLAWRALRESSPSLTPYRPSNETPAAVAGP